MNDPYQGIISNAIIAMAEKLQRDIDYIEVGVYQGDSALNAFGTKKVRAAVLVDNWSSQSCGLEKGLGSSAKTEATLQDYLTQIKIMSGDSKDVLPRITDLEFDVGFVDGAAGRRLLDMENMLPLIRHTGIMFVDDVRHKDCPTLEREVIDFAAKHQLKYVFHGVHNGLSELRLS